MLIDIDWTIRRADRGRMRAFEVLLAIESGAESIEFYAPSKVQAEMLLDRLTSLARRQGAETQRTSGRAVWIDGVVVTGYVTYRRGAAIG